MDSIGWDNFWVEGQARAFFLFSLMSVVKLALI